MEFLNDNEKAFLTLVRMGLWEKDCESYAFNNIDFSEIYRLSQEQTVVGIVAASFELFKYHIFPKDIVLEIAGKALQIECRNLTMNHFIGDLFEKMQAEGIYAVLIKGQGISQCYERPLWRTPGDIDLLLDDSMYIKACAFFSSMASTIEAEDPYMKHLAMTVSHWEIELHGNIRGGLGKRIDKVLDTIRDIMLNERGERFWTNGVTNIFLPEANNDVIFVFAHILQHFFKGGIGLRQICDWCRLLWTYRDKIDTNLLSDRINAMGLWTEWKSFAALVVNSLGMPEEAMPFYSPSKRWRHKADKILRFILDSGNFGLNKRLSHRYFPQIIMKKIVTLYRITDDSIKLFSIFPKDSLRVWSRMFYDGTRRMINN